jgi:hypothetical protein
MFPTRQWVWPAVDQTTVPPLCPNCGRLMHLDRVVEENTGFSERTFRCGECWATEDETSFSRP